MVKTFDELRSVLEKQYENMLIVPESGWSEEQLRSAIAQHRADNPEEERILSRAFITSLLLEHAPVALEKENPFGAKKALFNLMQEDLEAGYRLAEKNVPGYCGWGHDPALGITWMTDRSHVAPDWERLLKLGIPGIIAEAEKGNSVFHKAVSIVFHSLGIFCERAGRLNGNPVLEKLGDHAPQTLYEAFLLAFILHDAIEDGNEEVRSMGKFDALYIDFYRNDLKAGRLTRNSAKELIKFFWIAFYAKYQGKRFGKNFCFGPEFNELSTLALEAYYELNTVDPKLSILVKDSLPQDFAELYARCIRDGRTSIVSLNYDVIVEGLIRHGRTKEDAENFIPIGCYEPAVAGKEISLSGATHLYLPETLLAAMKEHENFADFDDVKRSFFDKIHEACTEMSQRQITSEKGWYFVNPVPLLSGTFEACMKKSLDITQGGAEYNTTGTVISYLADAVDSLCAIRFLVFEEKHCTIPELKQILADNWQGHEKLRRIVLTKLPRWGNNDEKADSLAREIASFCSRELWELPNGRNGHFFPSLYGQLVVENGKQIPALPSGRLAREPMSKNMDSVIGMDKRGITSLMNSVLKIDMRQFPCGTCLDLMLHPTSVTGDEGIRLLVSLIRKFIAKGGSGLQFNIFDAAKLRDAQKNPQNYANLQVRVCGWNVRFVDLDPAAQETFIRQAEEIA